MHIYQIDILIFNFINFYLHEDGFTVTLRHNCIYNRLPEDEPSGSKHIEDIKN
jgi:hypothetical protein